MPAVVGRAEEARWDLRPKPAHRPIGTIPAPDQPIRVRLTCDEITTIDPRTRQPDFVTAEIEYVPRRRLIDSKAMHAYIVRLRDHGYSMERLATVLARDVADSCSPEWVEVTVHEKPRGGVSITAVCRIAEQQGEADDGGRR